MTWRQRYHLRSVVRSSLWIVPLGSMLLAVVTAPIVRMIDDATRWRLLDFQRKGAVNVNMYFTDDSLLPENQDPLIITAAPWGPAWVPSDYPEDIAVSWDDQIQKAVDCYNAGATILHIHETTGKLPTTRPSGSDGHPLAE